MCACCSSTAITTRQVPLFNTQLFLFLGGMRPPRFLLGSPPLLSCLVLTVLLLLWCVARMVSVVRQPTAKLALVMDNAGTTPAVDPVEKASAVADADCWVFQHQHKSGGMTIRRIMNPPKGDLDADGEIVGYGTDEWRLGGRFVDATLVPQLLGERRYRIATGGYTGSLRLSPAVAKNCQYFTIFRCGRRAVCAWEVVRLLEDSVSSFF